MRLPRSSGFGYRPRPVGLVLALGLLAGVSGPLAQAAPAPGTIERVSVAHDGAERNLLPTGSTTSCAPGTATSGNCSHRTISESGSRVVFTSRASNLVDADNNKSADVYLAELNIQAGAAPTLSSLKRVSVASGGGAEGNGDSESPTISPNGEWIAFESKATNLVPSDSDPLPDIFVYRVSDGALFHATAQKIPTGGGPGNSFAPSVADNGTVAYTSYSTWLVPGGNAGYQQVFVTKDPAGAAEVEMVSVSTDPAAPGPGDGAPSKEASISADGTKVAFNTGAKNIGASEGANVGATDDVAVRNLTNDTTVRLTTGAKTITPSISPDGNTVAFAAEMPIGGSDADVRKDVYVASSSGGSIQLVSACTCGGDQNFDRPAVAPQINSAGAVVFQSAARFSDVRSEQVWKSGTPTLVSKAIADGAAADAVAELPSINGDGSMIAFTSAAANLVPNDFNGSADVFVAQMGPDGPTAMVRVSQTPAGREASGFAMEPTAPAAVSGDGNIVAFESDSTNLVPGDTNGVSDVFVRDRAANTTTRISVGAGGAQADGGSFRPAISADGNKIVFESTATNLIAGDSNQTIDIFIYDRSTGEVKRLSNGNFGQSSFASRNPSISPNGQWVAFESASDLTNAQSTKVQVYRVNSNGGQVELVSKANKTPVRAPDRDSTDPSVSDDGSVAFLSLATKLVSDTPDPRPNAQDVFVARPNGVIVRATVNNDGQNANGDSFDPAISADGSKVVFSSLSDNLAVPGVDANPDLDVFVRDLAANRTTMVSIGMGNTVPSGLSYAPAINANGSLVAFVSTASNLVPGDNNGVEDVFLANLGNGGMARVSVRPGVENGEANNKSYTPSLSGDGLVVVFKSSASNLVDNDNNGAFDTFVRTLTEVPQVCTTCGGTDPGIKGLGYRFVAADGGIFSFDQQFYGSAGATKLNRPIVGMASTPSNQGYWLVASDGGVFSYGDAGFHGSTGNIRLNSPIVGIAGTPSGKGYWFVAADGGIFSFGDAGFHGSMGGKPLNRPIVGMAATKTGKGYWLVASDGGIFSFGDAEFFGSTGNIKLNKPIVGMDRSNGGKGYRFVASDGGIFSFGDAKFVGSAGDIKLNKPIVGMARTRVGEGYWLVASDGGIFSFGDAKFFGSTGDLKLNSPIVGMAS
jgi:Tol biopolymer transport system component